LVERLAKRTHEGYLADGLYEENHEANCPWSRLSGSLKSQNRDQVRDNFEKFRRAGLLVRRADSCDGTPLEKLEAETVESLARDEHARWSDHKRAQGWDWGPRVDKERKKHDCLVAWSDLDEKTREKDRRPIERFVALLGEEGLVIVDPETSRSSQETS